MGKTTHSHYPNRAHALPTLRPSKSVLLSKAITQEYTREASHWRMDVPRLAVAAPRAVIEEVRTNVLVIAWCDGYEMPNYLQSVQISRKMHHPGA